MEKRSATRFEAGFKETDGCVEAPEVEKDTLKRCYGVLKNSETVGTEEGPKHSEWGMRYGLGRTYRSKNPSEGVMP